MITRKEAIGKVDYVMDHSDLVKDLIFKIYESIGTCGECEYASEADIGKDIRDCSRVSFFGSYYKDKSEYCSEFKRKKNG